MKHNIFGLSGTFGSGKDTLAHYLVQQFNFLHVSTGDMVRAVAEAQYGNIERPTLMQTANELREKRGPGVLAALALERFHAQIQAYDGIIISGVRSLGEADTIKQAGGKIIFIDAPVEVRYERVKDRHRDTESQLSLEAFKAGEAKETRTVHDDPSVQDLAGVKERADLILNNSGDVEVFFTEAVQKLGLAQLK